MNKNIQLIVFVIVFACCMPIANSVELNKEPIQDQLERNIYFADDSWDINSDGSKTESTKKKDVIQIDHGRQKYSMGKAVLYSALLPGLGERYVGKSTKSKLFFASEALTWVGYFSFRMIGKWKKDDFIDYASRHATAQLDGKDEQFLDHVGFYNSLEEFNSLGRVTDPDRLYYPNSAEFFWQWDSDDSRLTFKDIKNSSKEAYRKADFMIVIAVINRLVSIIDVVRDVKRENSRVATNISTYEERKIKLSINPLSNSKQIKLTFYPSF